MTELINLNEHNIYTADLSAYYEVEPGKYFLVYAPLKGVFFIADKDGLQSLPEQLFEPDEQILSAPHITHPEQFTKLTIMPNLTCNFACRYCYSAKGRSTTRMSLGQLKTMLDFFIDGKRVTDRQLDIFISGGGEPTLSWETVVYAVEYAEQLAVQHDKTLNIMLMTNGSLITDEIIDFLLQHDLKVGVSFDILPDVQNSQRGKYDTVSANIRRMLARGLAPTISAVITPLNVGRMSEMVNCITKDYKGIRHLNFDPAISDELYADAGELSDFYTCFVDGFFTARKLAAENNITLDCNAVRHAEKIFPRYCEGKLCLIPDGNISMCHTVSSPREKHYQALVYGSVNNGMVEFDLNKFNGFITLDNYLLPQCNDCIARYHCAGGCMMARKEYDERKMEAVCRFTRDMTTRLLLLRLDNAYQKRHGKTIKDLLV